LMAGYASLIGGDSSGHYATIEEHTLDRVLSTRP